MHTPRHTLLGAAALALACQAPSCLAAYASASGDAAFTIAGGAGYELLFVNVPPSASRATVGDALAEADGLATALGDGLLLTGAASADALFPPASAANAGYGSVQPLFVINTSCTDNPLEFDFDWSFVVSALNDFVAPSETATSTLTISLQQIVNDATVDLFSTVALATLDGGASADAGRFTYAYQLAPGEITTFLVGINASSFASTAVPVPASVLMLAPALGMLMLRRRVA